MADTMSVEHKAAAVAALEELGIRQRDDVTALAGDTALVTMRVTNALEAAVIAGLAGGFSREKFVEAASAVWDKTTKVANLLADRVAETIEAQRAKRKVEGTEAPAAAQEAP
jgi:outer membrane murein-binding lipoprotein Lpp